VPAVSAAQSSVNQRIQARDGDFVFVQNAEQVRVVRRREAMLRVLYQPAQRWIIVMVDYASPGVAPDNLTDVTYRYHDISGDWPLGERWEGKAAIDEYSFAGDYMQRGIGLSLPSGLIQILSSQDGGAFANRAAYGTLTFRSASRGARDVPFDATEREEVPMASAAASRIPAPPPPDSNYPTPTGAVRVGGNIKPPLKVRDVRPVYPRDALASRVTGVVIMEAVIAADGSVTDTKILRSVPLLDNAAVDAVRQWRFEPTHVNGVAVPVIMTVTVSFNLQ
jgi:TonB family protein